MRKLPGHPGGVKRRRLTLRTPIGLAMAAILAVAAAQAFAPRETPPLGTTRLALERMHLNTIASTKGGLVAAGELGTLIVSANQGGSWQRASVDRDRQALINHLGFASDGLRGMAVGHEGWILRTADGGWSWTEVAFDAQNGEPLMAVAQLPTGRWIVVGAFGRALQSTDDGKSWSRLALPESGVEDKHLNRIVGSPDGQHWLIIGERGLVLRSDDRGESWAHVDPFYNGSFYNAAALPQGGWLVYGMRGHVYRSGSAKASWNRVELGAPVSFFGHAQAGTGRLLLVGQGGMVATSTDAGASFTLARTGGRATLTDITVQADGRGWLTSDAGLKPYPPAAPTASLTTPGAAR